MRRRLLIIFIAFCLSFIAMVALSLFSIERFTTFTNYSAEVDHSNKVIRMLYKTEVYLKDIDRLERGYILTNDTIYKKPVYRTIDSIRPAMLELERITKDNNIQRNNIAILKSDITLRINHARADMEYVDSTHSKEASTHYYEGREFMKSANRKIREMHKVEDDLLAERSVQEEFYQHLTTSSIKVLLIVFCLITLVLFVILAKLMRSRMQNQEELQAKVIDLQRSHNELQEIAFVASHDLQEPLRKIQVFSNMLLFQKTDKIENDIKGTLERINASANQMQLLINALTSLTTLTKIDEEKAPLHLNRIIQYLLIDVEEIVKEKNAVVNVQELPEIKGYETQIRILFRALLDNALKFTRDGVQPAISIHCDIINGTELAGINPNLRYKKFYRISCADNGIGFDNQYISKIFQIFQRLHKMESKYEGKGMGLAICQRIMANHEGYVIGDGIPQKGAKFMMYFPVE